MSNKTDTTSDGQMPEHKEKLDPREILRLVYLALKNRQSIFELIGDKDVFIRSLELRELRAEVAKLMMNNFFPEHSSYDEDVEMVKMQSYLPEIEILELMRTIEDRPLYSMLLGSIYIKIGRQKEGLDLLYRAASEKGHLIEMFIESCIKAQDYKRIIDFYEEDKQRIIRCENNNKVIAMVAIVHERTANGLSPADKSRILEEGYDAKSYNLMEEAKRLYSIPYENSIRTGSGSPSDIENIMNYAQSLIQQASIIRHMKDGTIENIEDASELCKEAIGILQDVIQRLQKIREIYGVSDPHSPVLNNLFLAKAHLLSAYHDDSFSDKELMIPIKIAEELLNLDPEYLEGQRWYNTVLHNYVEAVHSYFKKTGELPVVLTDDERSKKTESILWVSAHNDWASFKSWDTLANFYAKRKDEKKFQMVTEYTPHALFLRALVDIDKYEQDQSGYTLALYDKHEDKKSETRPGFIERRIVDIKSCFEPLFKALEPYIKSYEEQLRKAMPPGAVLEHRLKDPYSIILKMLKEKKDRLPQITDIVGFRVLTDTEEQARDLYDSVKGSMGRVVKEWNTLDNPTETNYRSLDITGYPEGADDFLVQVQVRPKPIEREIQNSFAHHEYMKKIKGSELESNINENPMDYLNLLADISTNLKKSADAIGQAGDNLSLKEVLNLYENPAVG